MKTSIQAFFLKKVNKYEKYKDILQSQISKIYQSSKSSEQHDQQKYCLQRSWGPASQTEDVRTWEVFL